MTENDTHENGHEYANHQVELTTKEVFQVVYALTNGYKALERDGKEDTAEEYEELADKVGGSIE